MCAGTVDQTRCQSVVVKRATCKCLIYQWVYPNLWLQALGSDRRQAAESGWALRGRVRRPVTLEQWSSRASSGTWGTRSRSWAASEQGWHVSPHPAATFSAKEDLQVCFSGT